MGRSSAQSLFRVVSQTTMEGTHGEYAVIGVQVSGFRAYVGLGFRV